MWTSQKERNYLEGSHRVPPSSHCPYSLSQCPFLLLCRVNARLQRAIILIFTSKSQTDLFSHICILLCSGYDVIQDRSHPLCCIFILSSGSWPFEHILKLLSLKATLSQSHTPFQNLLFFTLLLWRQTSRTSCV